MLKLQFEMILIFINKVQFRNDGYMSNKSLNNKIKQLHIKTINQTKMNTPWSCKEAIAI